MTTTQTPTTETTDPTKTPSPAENGHVLLTPRTCPCKSRPEDEWHRQCPVCDGGLAVCERCGDYEAGLDRPCLGSHEARAEADAETEDRWYREKFGEPGPDAQPVAADAAIAIDPEPDDFALNLLSAAGPELMHGGYEPGPTLGDLWAAKEAARTSWEDFGGTVESPEGRLRLQAYAASYKRFMLGIAQLPHDICVEYDGLSFSRDDSDKWPFGAATRRKVDGASVRVLERTSGAKEVADVA